MASDSDVPSKLYEFTKSFVASAEKALKELEDPSTVSKVSSKILSAIAEITKGLGPPGIAITGVSKTSAAAVPYLSQKIWQKINTYRVNKALSIDSSQNFKDVFKTVFISAAIEIYHAFEFQLQNVYLKVEEKEDMFQALQILGSYAGERCFKQLLKTGSPENLHRILVSSISSKSGYSEFEDETSTKWKSILSIADDTYEQFMCSLKSKLTDKLRFCTTEKSKNKTTALEFFDQCIPGFNFDVPKNKPKLVLSSNEIFVDKEKWNKTKLNKYYLLRPPFKVEAENIQENNLKNQKYVSPASDRRKKDDFKWEDSSQMTHLILKELNRDISYDPVIAHFNLALQLCSQVKKIQLDIKGQGSQLRKMQSGINVLLSRSAHYTAEKLPRVRFQVPHPPESFVGRTDILNKIKKIIDCHDEKQRLTVFSQTHIISGLGGVGKTTTACEFIRIFETEYPGCNVLFIHAETYESLKEDFLNLALKLKFLKDRKDFDWEIVKDEVYERICDRKCLIVYDNAQSLKNENKKGNGIEKFFPSPSSELISNLSILITTRNCESTSWGNRKPIFLDVFEKNEAINFVNEMLGDNQEKANDIRKLVKLCGSLPLALKLTVAFIKENNSKLFKSGYSIEQFLAEEKIKSLVGNNPESILYRTWDLSLADISKLPNGELAMFIFNIMAFSTRPSIVDIENIQEDLITGEMEESIGEALGLLVKYSLISKISDPTKRGYYSIHRMIQMVTKERLKADIEGSVKFFAGLVSNANHTQSNMFIFFKVLSFIYSIFDWMSYDWQNENAWSFANKIVTTLMGEENVNCYSSLMSRVHDITMNYLGQNDHVDTSHIPKVDKHSRLFPKVSEGKGENRVFWNFPECLTGQSSSDPSRVRDFGETNQLTIAPTNYRLVFFASEEWNDFRQKAKCLNPTNNLVKMAEDYFENRGVILSQILKSGNKDKDPKVILLVVIEKVQTSLDSSVWVINPKDKQMPDEICQFDSEGKDLNVAFLLMQSKYYEAFSFLLRIIYTHNLNNSSSMMPYLIGLNMLVPIVSKAKFTNAVGVIQSLIGLIGIGRSIFIGKKFCVVDNYSIKDICDDPRKELSKFSIEFSTDRYKFIKAFVESAEEALKSLQEALGEAASVSQFLIATSHDGDSRPVTTLSQEIWQNINTYKIKNCVSIDSSQTFQGAFQEVFLNVAMEIFSAYMLQLKYVFLTVNKRINHGMALKMLGRYAGKRCFQQLLTTGSFENLHFILVPSIASSSGYNLEKEGKVYWGIHQNMIDTKILEVETSTNEIFDDTLFYFHKTERVKYDTNFFDDCIPAFYPHIPQIKWKLKEQNLTWTSESYVVDEAQIRKIKRKSKKFSFLRLPFKVEAEKIKDKNLKVLENEPTETDTIPVQFMYPNVNVDYVMSKILLENWDLSLACNPEISKGELALLIFKCLVFVRWEMEVATFKHSFGRGETLESLIEAFELLVEYCLIIKYEDPEDERETYYNLNPMLETAEQWVLGSSEKILNFFLYLASAMNHCEPLNDHIRCVSSCVLNLFSWVSKRWKDQDAWDFAMEIVRTMIGKEHLDSAARFIPIIYSIAAKYSKRSYDYEHIPRNLYYTPVKKLVLFLISETFEDFERQAKALHFSTETVKRSKNYFTKTCNPTSDAMYCNVLLTVFIGNVENPSDSGVWVFDSSLEKKDLPDCISNYYWEDDDLQSAFFLLPVKYCSIFNLLLGQLFFVDRYHRHSLQYFIGAIMLAEIVLSTEDPNAIDTIHSLLALIGFNCDGSDDIFLRSHKSLIQKICKYF